MTTDGRDRALGTVRLKDATTGRGALMDIVEWKSCRVDGLWEHAIHSVRPD